MNIPKNELVFEVPHNVKKEPVESDDEAHTLDNEFVPIKKEIIEGITFKEEEHGNDDEDRAQQPSASSIKEATVTFSPIVAESKTDCEDRQIHSMPLKFSQALIRVIKKEEDSESNVLSQSPTNDIGKSMSLTEANKVKNNMSVENLQELQRPISFVQTVNNRKAQNACYLQDRLDMVRTVHYRKITISDSDTAIGTDESNPSSMEKPFKCKICCLRFSGTGNLNTHMRTHTGERPFECEICHFRSAQSSGLKLHIMRIHTGEKPHECNVCGSRFAVVSGLRAHMRTHTGEKPYGCKKCGSRFSDPCSLKRHLRTHTGEKPYACKVCSSRFAFSYSLNTHMRTHTGEKPYECEICSSRFVERGTLKTHMRTHTGEKPYKCENCGSRFAYKCTIKKHRFRCKRNGEKPISANTCVLSAPDI